MSHDLLQCDGYLHSTPDLFERPICLRLPVEVKAASFSRSVMDGSRRATVASFVVYRKSWGLLSIVGKTLHQTKLPPLGVPTMTWTTPCRKDFEVIHHPFNAEVRHGGGCRDGLGSRGRAGLCFSDFLTPCGPRNRRETAFPRPAAVSRPSEDGNRACIAVWCGKKCPETSRKSVAAIRHFQRLPQGCVGRLHAAPRSWTY